VADEEGATQTVMDLDPPFDTSGLREISNLASWTVSSSKPGCGIPALLSPDTSLFWQSDGPQPHYLNIHFARLASIVAIRIYLDFELDESYTPTRITLSGGTGYHDLIGFASLEFSQPKGWIDVPLEMVGGGRDGNELKAWLVQVKVVENHQNGKDTHVRGLRLYARDERADGRLKGIYDSEDIMGDVGGRVKGGSMPPLEKMSLLAEPDWMKEPVLR
jgi:anaphase-promoting complex subunit 10